MFQKLRALLPKKSKKDDSAELARELAERMCSGRTFQMTDEDFSRISLAISQVIKELRPVGSAKNINVMAGAISEIIEQNGITQKQWCDEVWRRGGHKDTLSYNHK